MTVLVDTRCWLWMNAAPERLSPAALELVLAPRVKLWLSAASAWEIAIKSALGRLRLPEPPSQYVPRRLTATRTVALPVTHVHALRVAELPPHHRDPFDRLLVAQAQIERVPILTADAQFESYEIEVIPAAGLSVKPRP